ncbi:10357_t:CDS:2 [Funneliformis geosporum]|nr:10357_t:CDS:2 [Funneliformis geosporum]
MLGIDRGVRKLFATNQEWKFYNPKYWNKIRKRYIELQQILSRKVKGSNNWRKTLNELKRLCRRVANRIKDKNHKISRKLVNKNDLLVLEKLNSSKMISKENKKAKGAGDKELFKCPNCSYEKDRDVNASQNILEKGIKKLKLQRLGTALCPLPTELVEVVHVYLTTYEH